MPDRLYNDFETFSELDVTSVGADRYARDPSTRPLMLAYALNSGKVRQWVPAEREPMPRDLKEMLLDPEVIKCAWNWQFEWHIFTHCLGIEIPIEQCRCTMTLASTLSLPMGLAKAGPVLGIPSDKQKLADGKKLIRLFCGPIKPTKKYKATRAFPHTHSDEWERFKEYNRVDVEAERAIYQRIRKWEMPRHEWEMWFLDHKINQRGIPINLDAVENACEVIIRARKDRFDELAEITGLENPGSRDQILKWLRDHGYPYADLKAAHVKGALNDIGQMLAAGAPEDELLRALTLRSEISRTSVDKFFALQRASSDDGNLRNSLQFAGAGRTWRWSGRIYQPQNLARPSREFEAPEKAIEAVTDLEMLSYEQLSEKYPRNLIDMISASVRPVVQAPDGYVLIDADQNAIENRVLGWMADDRKILKVFAQDRDPYVDFATYMYQRPYAELMAEYTAGDKSKRTIAKPGVLGCLAPETPVLTTAGWKALIELTADDWIFDGAEWVRHAGVLYQGEKQMLCRSGVYATPDHKFLVSTEWKEWQQVIQPRMFGKALATANGASYRMLAAPAAPEKFIGAGVLAGSSGTYPGQTSSEGYPLVAPDALLLTVAPISGKESARTCSTFSQIVSVLRARVAKIRKIQLTNTTEGAGFVCASKTPPNGSATWLAISDRTEPLKSTASKMTGTTNPETSGSQPESKMLGTVGTVWDVFEAGPRNQFAVLSDDGLLIASNCGYMLSAGYEYEDSETGETIGTGLLGYAANMGVKLTPELAKLSVDTWRKTYTQAVDFWYEIERAAMRTVATGKPTECWPVHFDISGPMLRMILPSGRALHYVRPRLETKMMPWGKEKRVLTYEGLNDKNQWVRIDTHPGKITENADQAISRDVLAVWIKRCEAARLPIRLHVHDQVCALVRQKYAEEALEIMCELGSEPIDWAPGLPLKAVGTISKYFLKD